MYVDMPTGMFFLTVGGVGFLGGLASLFVLVNLFGLGRRGGGSVQTRERDDIDKVSGEKLQPRSYSMVEVLDLYLSELSHALYNLEGRHEYGFKEEDIEKIKEQRYKISKIHNELFTKSYGLQSVINHSYEKLMETNGLLLDLANNVKDEDIKKRLQTFGYETRRMRNSIGDFRNKYSYWREKDKVKADEFYRNAEKDRAELINRRESLESMGVGSMDELRDLVTSKRKR